MDLIHSLLSNPIAAAFLIIVIGALLGRVSVGGVSLGSSGVLFAALAFGQIKSVDPAALKPLGDLGVVLFVYAIGLQAGPRFVRTVRSKGAAPLVVGLLTVIGAAGLALGVGSALGLRREMIVGVFAGALTSTPALAAATEVSQSPLVSVTYGVSYPIGVIAVVMFAQLIPRWLNRRAEQKPRREDAPPADPILKRCFRVENPGCIDKPLSALQLHTMVAATVSRIQRAGEVLPYDPHMKLETGDILLAVGTRAELDRMTVIIGPCVDAQMERNPDVVSRDVYITEHALAGKSLAELRVLDRYGVVITRIRRECIEFLGRGNFVLEIGDLVRAVGHESEVAAFAQAAGIREQRIHETGIPAFAFGLVLGLLVGFTPIPLPGGGTVKLGLAGGPLFVGLLLGHLGRIGPLRVHVPTAGRYLMRELGLVLFLASAGTSAGSHLIEVLTTQGWQLAVLATTTAFVGVTLGSAAAYIGYRQSVASTVGMTCGAMTSTPGLGAASGQFESDVPALSYAAVYPLALVAMTVVAQLMLTAIP